MIYILIFVKKILIHLILIVLKNRSQISNKLKFLNFQVLNRILGHLIEIKKFLINLIFHKKYNNNNENNKKKDLLKIRLWKNNNRIIKVVI